MNTTNMPEAYIGREQAFIKHSILSTYLVCLFMIIGKKESVINYVDCFAGPWEDESEELKSTSIGISLSQMESCIDEIKKIFKRTVRFRALYIEKDPVAFQRLDKFCSEYTNPNIEVSCMKGDYTNHISDIVKWTNNHFTFFFVDPKGWKKIIGGITLSTLLKLERTEFLINLMYDFANRSVSIKKHEDDMMELLGEIPSFTGEESAYVRQHITLTAYRNNINSFYKGKTAYVPIERPGKDRVLYFLIYLTRHPLGIAKFKETAEKMMNVQRITHQETKLRKQYKKSGTVDMFEDEAANFQPDYSDNRFGAKRYLLKKISKEGTLIDYELWSHFLEETEYYPTDFQLAMKDLLKEDKIENMDANVHRRCSKFIKPNYPNKSERWRLV